MSADHCTPIDLIQRDGIDLCDSRIIAKRLDNDHKATYALIKKYTSEFNDFGKVLFEKAASDSGQKESIALLNEGQSLFLLTLSRNNKKVVPFKRDLVIAYQRARDVAQATNIAEAVAAAVNAAIAPLLSRIVQLEAQPAIQQLPPPPPPYFKAREGSRAHFGRNMDPAFNHRLASLAGKISNERGIKVRDNGPGVPNEYREDVLDEALDIMERRWTGWRYEKDAKKRQGNLPF